MRSFLYKYNVLCVVASLFGYCDKVECYREVELQTDWEISSENFTQETCYSLPVGVYSIVNSDDSEAVLKSRNDANLRWIAKQTWNFTKQFLWEERATCVFLTFHGIDTIATIYLNDQYLGETDNMFVRYSFRVEGILKRCNILRISISSPVNRAKELARNYSLTPPECPPESYNGECHINFLRKMQSSFSSKWTLAAPSIGIWKPVVLEIYDVSMIRDIDISTRKEGDQWILTGRVYFETASKEDFRGILLIHFVDLLEEPHQINSSVSHSNPVIDFEISFNQDIIELWWPNGYGKQILYIAHFTWTSYAASKNQKEFPTKSHKSIKFGFREIELIQKNATNGLTFFFQVNRVAIFAKGTTWIPSHILPEKMNDKRIEYLLKSAKTANVNMIRIWGGGIYESDRFYDLADCYGLLIWHELMFASSMYPISENFTRSVKDEIQQNVRRISYHPSIAAWIANDENEVAFAENWFGTNIDEQRFKGEYIKLYIDTVLEVLKANTKHIILISTPSNGVKSEENGFLSSNPQDNKFGDVHHLQYTKDPFNPNSYDEARFVSHFGFKSIPFLTSWKRSMSDNDIMEDLFTYRRREYDLDAMTQLIETWFPVPKPGKVDYWENFIYLTQLTQAMIVKTQTEAYRTQRLGTEGTMGAIYGQLNDVWVAPSESGIDYYGNYKILLSWSKHFLAPVTVIAHFNRLSDEINVYVAQDSQHRSQLRITMNIYLWSRLFPHKSKEVGELPASLEPFNTILVSKIPLRNLLTEDYNTTNCFFEFLLENDEEVLSSTFFFPDVIKNAHGIMNPNLEIKIEDRFSCESGRVTVNIIVTVVRPAVFIFFEVIRLSVEDVQFSENGYIQTERAKTITLKYFDRSCTVVKQRNIRVLTLNQLMKR